MSEQYDIVSMGAGHNGMTAAAYLAKAGKSVLLLERNPIIGGGVITKEMPGAPGFLYDQHSTAHIMLQGNPMIRQDELELQSKFGLEYTYSDVPLATIFEDQTCIITYRDVDRTCESIAKISPQDAETYRKLAKTSLDMLPMFVSGLYAPPVPMASFYSTMSQTEEGRETLMSMQRSTLDVVNEMFVNDKIKIHLLKCTAENLQSPEEFGTGMGIGQPIGGSGVLATALKDCIEYHGGKIIVDCEVSRVIVEHGRAVGLETTDGEQYRANDAVIAGIHPYKLGEFVEGIPQPVLDRANSVKLSPFSLLVSHYALEEPMNFYAHEDATKATMLETLLTSDMDEFLQDFYPLKHGRMSDRHLMGGGSTCLNDPTRVPPGKGNAMLQKFAPYDLADGGAARWDEIKEAEADTILESYRHFVSNLGSENIISRLVDSPLDHERWSPNSFVKGDAHGAGPYFFQMNSNRPTSDLGQYKVPGVDRLYLVGPFMHPGGGVFGAGRGTAMTMFDDLGMDFNTVAKTDSREMQEATVESTDQSASDGIRILDANNDELMDITAIDNEGSSLHVKGKIFGTTPMVAVVRPKEARKMFRLLNFRKIIFLLTFLFRR